MFYNSYALLIWNPLCLWQTGYVFCAKNTFQCTWNVLFCMMIPETTFFLNYLWLCIVVKITAPQFLQIQVIKSIYHHKFHLWFSLNNKLYTHPSLLYMIFLPTRIIDLKWNLNILYLKPFFLSPLITKISIVHFHQIENWVPKKFPNNIHLNPKNMRDIHPRKVTVALLQFFHLLFLTNSITSQYSIN